MGLLAPEDLRPAEIMNSYCAQKNGPTSYNEVGPTTCRWGIGGRYRQAAIHKYMVPHPCSLNIIEILQLNCNQKRPKTLVKVDIIRVRMVINEV